jgi:hypothetical protein
VEERNRKEFFMAENDTTETLTKWLKEKGYSDGEIRMINEKLAKHDHQTLSDAVFDSIGGDGGSLEDMIAGLMKE